MTLSDCYLIAPSEEFREQFIEMAGEFLAAGDDRHKAAIDNFAGYLAKLSDQARGKNLPAGRVPQDTFWLLCGEGIVGVSKLRHYLTTELEREGGHIGYEIRPSERRKGFGTKILELTLRRAVIQDLVKCLSLATRIIPARLRSSRRTAPFSKITQYRSGRGNKSYVTG